MRAFFWSFFLRSLVVSIVYAAFIFVISVSVTYVWALAVGFSRGDTSLVFKNLPTVQMVFGLIFAVPGTSIWLRWLTRRTFASYAVRIVRGK